MKRLIVGLVLAVVAAGVSADALSDAAGALQKKNYAVAVAAYAKLADAGNADAMLQLGELYWYGEGVPLDRAKADALFARAAAAGNKNAAPMMKLSPQRQARMAEINWWVSGYDGADLTAGQFNCVAPTYPRYSETRREVKLTSEAYNAYVACYNGFVDNVSASMPAGKRIPEDVVILMSEQELGQARDHLGKVYTSVAARMKADAEKAMAQNTAWTDITESYLKNQASRRDQIISETTRQLIQNPSGTNFPMAPSGGR